MAYYVPLLLGTWVFVLAMRGAYERPHLRQWSTQVKDVFGTGCVVFTVLFSVSYGFKTEFSRGFLVNALCLSAVAILLSRRLLLIRLNWVQGFQPGTQRRLEIPDEHLQPLAKQWIVARPGIGPYPDGSTFQSWLIDLTHRINREEIDLVVLRADHGLSENQLLELTWALSGSADVAIAVASGHLSPGASLHIHGNNSYLYLGEASLRGPRAVVKRLLDITVAVFALVAFAPLLILTAAAVAVSSQGPIIYTQDRVGLHGKTFRLPKFRSMKVGSDKMRTTLIGIPDENIIHRYRSDPRITNIGRLIRRFSIDELPQLWVVLIGDMSIVGPRPILVEETQLLTSADRWRHAVKPGLTGLWQISGRKEVSWADRMRMDLEYVHNWTNLGDLLIMFRTIKAVLVGKGAV